MQFVTFIYNILDSALYLCVSKSQFILQILLYCTNAVLEYNYYMRKIRIVEHDTLGTELHLVVLVKEGLLDHTMCLPAVLPGECQPRARFLVNELSKHRHCCNLRPVCALEARLT